MCTEKRRTEAIWVKKKRGFWNGFLLFILIYAGAALLFFWIVHEDWQRTAVTTDPVNRDAVLPELAEGTEIEQDFTVEVDHPRSIVFYANRKPGLETEKSLLVTITAEDREVLSLELPYSSIAEDGAAVLSVKEMDGWPQRGKKATIRIRAEGEISLWYGRSRSAGKFLVGTETSGLRLNGEAVEGELVFSQAGEIELPYMHYYWPFALCLFAVLAGIILVCHSCLIHGKETVVHRGLYLIRQYRYLLKTLVVRDFKIKYKDSVLGVLWSFLNPLLMTFVYMFVFSTLFRNSIENFVVYLMSGIILFNYFSEATNLGMQSIVGNAGLITKVYIPKYIFPISKVLSSAINLVISLIPLLIMMALTGVRFSKSMFLIPLVLLLLVLFCVGVSLILAAAMVFFRDIQFLWGILLTILNFLSPIFYPESIIPARFITLYHMNPIYQYLFFMRTISLGGISPTPVTYLYCSLASLITLAAGLLIFRRAQTQFVLHL